MLATSRVMTDAVESLYPTGDFDTVVKSHQSRIFRFVLASLRDRDAAQTATQDCFMNAYRSWRHFRHQCSLDTWLMRIAINLVRDHIRNRRLQFWKHAELTAKPTELLAERLGDGRCSPEKQACLKQQVSAIWSAASKLPERQRTVFLLRFVEDMDLLEIAEATGMTKGSVKTHLFRALQVVRREME
jgi:RNA polymerase sigma-70 factor (ECF subfamily)